MISSILKVTGCVFVLCLVVPAVQAQNPVKKTSPSSISGKVTLNGDGIAGITVGARSRSDGRTNFPLVVATDQDGNYRISNLTPGEYDVMPAAPQFVLAGREPSRRLIINEGENIEGVDFALTRGGVIAGKVMDEDGRPVIEESVEYLIAQEANREPVTRLTLSTESTDDRGVYRIYGLPPGKYRVAAGLSENRLTVGRGRAAIYSQTFYPSTTEWAKAGVIEVTEGSEATNIDITLRRTQPAFTVTARVVDADTGQPIPDARYGIEKYRENGSSGNSGFVTNRRGEIRIDNVTPGKYALVVDRTSQGSIYAEPVPFAVIDQDVKDLVIKVSSGSSVSGVVIFEGVDEKTRISFGEITVFAHVLSKGPDTMGGHNSPTALINPDGTFTVAGLRPGVVHLGILGQPRAGSEFDLARVERDGVVQPNLEIKSREQIGGIRLVVKLRTGRIAGVVKFENGQLSPNSFVQIQLRRVGEENLATSMQMDERGRFRSELLTSGLYEVTAIAYQPRGRSISAKQQVVVTDGQVSETLLTLDLKSDSGATRP